jgi:cytochrome c
MVEKSIGEKRFLIVLGSEGDLKHILNPWLYQNDAFLVAEYDGISSAQEIPINIMPIWIRILDLPIPMMTQSWGEKIGRKFLGQVREVGKDNHGHVWASFLRLRIEHDVEQPIKRWIPLAGKEGGKPKRYEVKYEGAPHFCFFCGIFGHNERSCLLPEEEKIVKYCEEQRASPFRHAENRSYYVPADEKRIKRSLHFSPASSWWKCAPEIVDEDEEEGKSMPAQIQEVLATAVTIL